MTQLTSLDAIPDKKLPDTLWPAPTSRYAHAAISDSTRRAYRADLRHFLDWGGSLPSSTTEIVDYLEAHATSLSIRTLRRRVVTLKEAHRLVGMEVSPADDPLIKRVLRGIANTEGKPANKAPPLLIDQATDIIRRLDGSVAGIRDRALILVGWALFLRRSELVALERRDVSFQKDRAIVRVRRSKTDQESTGAMLAIPRLNGPACPVTALNHWLSLSGITDGPIFRRVLKGGNLGRADQGLTPHSVNLILKRRALEAGVEDPDIFSGHSLRRGGITQAYASDQNESDIQRVSRHQSLVQLRDYQDASAALMGTQPSASFIEALNERLQPETR